jgi:hypothetical protein
VDLLRGQDGAVELEPGGVAVLREEAGGAG